MWVHTAAARAAPGHMDPCTVWWCHGITGAQCDVNLRSARVDSRGSLAHAAAKMSIYRQPRKSVNTPESSRVCKRYQTRMKKKHETKPVALRPPCKEDVFGYQCIKSTEANEFKISNRTDESVTLYVKTSLRSEGPPKSFTLATSSQTPGRSGVAS